MTIRTSIFDRLDNSPVRTSVERLADDAPVARHRPPYIDDTPVMLAAHAAIEAEARATAAAVIKMAARAYALKPRGLDEIMMSISKLSPPHLVLCLSRIGPLYHNIDGREVPAINLRGAQLYARYLRAKAHQIARRAA